MSRSTPSDESATPAGEKDARMPFPDAMQLADAFGSFGDARHEAVRTVRSLPAAAQWVVVDRRVRWLPDGHPAVPARLSERLDQVRHLSASGAPSICGYRSDGHACVVLGRAGAIPYEIIEVAQRFVSPQLRGRLMAALVQQGQAVITAARDAVRAGQPARDYGDLTAIRDRRRAFDLANPEWIAALRADLRETCAPALAALGREHGLVSDQAMRASVYAAYFHEHAALDPNGAVGMTLVAYRYEEEQRDALIEHLYLTAASSERGTIRS